MRRPALAGRCLEPGAPWGSPRRHRSLAEAGKPREGKLTQITEELGGGVRFTKGRPRRDGRKEEQSKEDVSGCKLTVFVPIQRVNSKE